tara:strand:+ start:671 stop:919 length:249 start_codon:yes stop_codon:yes gene_type:complete
MTNKNPFEIRLEVLKMAKDMVTEQHATAMNTYWNTLDAAAETWNKSVEDLIVETQKMKPEMYTPQEIMKKAQELYSFVSNKD